MKLKGLKKVCTATKNISNGCEIVIWVNPKTLVVDADEVLCGTILCRGDGSLHVVNVRRPMTMDDIEREAVLRLWRAEAMRSRIL